ncbi:hypothetical protein M5689_010424 [Euphorbia peplus]|nr:hypothetical protein M5689_010424 [Euphorbia peplus]
MAETRLRLLWLPKCISGETNRITTAPSGGGIEESGSEERYSCWSCGGVRKVLKKLKKQRRKLRWYGGGGRRQSSVQCRYDPMSYSLNFDSSSGENLADDQDYYRFCAFSSRFATNNSLSETN